ncbi:MAG: tail fiber domain-containing protein [Deltaproteobacteria bacterium]|nr:tail fiber domain-containing protein [Deltaproteobacteria bacterium]
MVRSLLTSGNPHSVTWAELLSKPTLYWVAATGGINYAGGNVGIGDTTPTYKLDVAGQIRSTTGIFSNSNTVGVNIGTSTTSYPNLILKVDESTTNNGADVSITAAANSGSAGLNFYALNWGCIYRWQKGSAGGAVTIMRLDSNNLGIGLGDVAASERLTVQGDIRIQYPTTQPALHLYRLEQVNTNWVLGQINFGSYSTGTTIVNGAVISAVAEGLWQAASIPTALVFKTTPSSSTTLAEIMRISSEGEVGIGTNNPSAKLHVVGTLIQSDGRADFHGPDNGWGLTVQPSAATSESGFYSASSNLSLYLKDSAGSTKVALSSTDNNYLINNVQIGTFTPSSAKLYVEGTMQVNGIISHKGIHINDTRGDGDALPNSSTFPEYALSLSFTDDIALSPNVWDGVITMKAWTGAYGVWQLLSNANSAAGINTEPLMFRSGLNGSWGALRRVIMDNGGSDRDVELEANLSVGGYGAASIPLCVDGNSAGTVYATPDATQWAYSFKPAGATGTSGFYSLSSHARVYIRNATGADRCRFDSNGDNWITNDLALGHSNPGEKLDVVGNVKVSGVISTGTWGSNISRLQPSYLYMHSSAKQWNFLSAGDGHFYLQKLSSTSVWEANYQFNANGNVLFPHDFHANGTISSTGTCCSSDRSIKKNFSQVTDSKDILSVLTGNRFNWKANGEADVGLIAQDVEKVLPELVKTVEGIKHLNYNGIVAVLVEGYKSLEERLSIMESNYLH